MERRRLLATLFVTNTADSGPGSLRQAIFDANDSIGVPDTIAFNIPGDGTHVIGPMSPLPTVTDPLAIDGETQPGAAGGPLIILDGGSAGTGADGLQIQADDSLVRGLHVRNFDGDGIDLLAGASGDTIGGTTTGARNVISGNGGSGVRLTGAVGNRIMGNFVGLAPDGTTNRGNDMAGVFLSAGASGNTIGAATSGGGNVISGNGQAGVAIVGGSGNVVQNNFLGTDAAGAVAVANGAGVVLRAGAANNLVGAVGGALGGNVISGNAGPGVSIQDAGTSGNVVAGNLIGTAVSGSSALPNTLRGVEIVGAANNTIGGTVATARNVISGNGTAGVGIVGGSGNTVAGNFIGTASDGFSPLPNARGVHLLDGSSGNTIGGLTTDARNVISGNLTFGLVIGNTDGTPGGGTANAAFGNFIGVGLDGKTAVPNGADGVFIQNSSSGNTIGATADGARNVIAFNRGNGVTVGRDLNDPSVGDSVRGNAIYSNGKLGIDLGDDGVTPNTPGGPHPGPNHLQNFPVIASVVMASGGTLVGGTLDSTPNATFAIDFYADIPAADGTDAGQTFLGSTTVATDASGHATFSARLLAMTGPGLVTATATSASGDTSEFTSRVAPSPSDLAVSQALIPRSPQPGAPFAYQIVVRNNGPSDVPDAVVADALPDALGDPSSVAIVNGGGATFQAGNHALVVNNLSVAAGASATIVVRFDQAPAGATLKNVVTVARASGEPDPNPSNNTSVNLAFVATPGGGSTIIIGPISQPSAGLLLIDVRRNGVEVGPLPVFAGSPASISGTTASDTIRLDLRSQGATPGLSASSTFTIDGGGGGDQFSVDAMPGVPNLDVLVVGLVPADSLAFSPFDAGQDVVATGDVGSPGQLRIGVLPIGAPVTPGVDPLTLTPVRLRLRGTPTVQPIAARGEVTLFGARGASQVSVFGTGVGAFAGLLGPGLPRLDFLSNRVAEVGAAETRLFTVAPLPGTGWGVAVRVAGLEPEAVGGSNVLQLINLSAAGSSIGLQGGPGLSGNFNFDGIDSVLVTPQKPPGSPGDSLTYTDTFPGRVLVAVVGAGNPLFVSQPIVGTERRLTITGQGLSNGLNLVAMAGQPVVVNPTQPAGRVGQGLAVLGTREQPGALVVNRGPDVASIRHVRLPFLGSGLIFVRFRNGATQQIAYTNMTPVGLPTINVGQVRRGVQHPSARPRLGPSKAHPAHPAGPRGVRRRY